MLSLSGAMSLYKTVTTIITIKDKGAQHLFGKMQEEVTYVFMQIV